MSMKNVRSAPESSTVLPPFGTPRVGAGKGPHLPPIVTIFGAGIAGLSAAHELIERGFSVQVVEPASSPDEEYAAEVGGLARNQFGRVLEDVQKLHRREDKLNKDLTDEQYDKFVAEVLRRRSRNMQRVQPRVPVPARIVFPRDSASAVGAIDPARADSWHVTNRVKLEATLKAIRHAYEMYRNAAPEPDSTEAEERKKFNETLDTTGKKLFQQWEAREDLCVEIRGHTDGKFTENENLKLSLQWAKLVKAYLMNGPKEQGSIPLSDAHFIANGVGSMEPLGDQRDEKSRERSNRVEFRIVEQLVPGEHGYRFFPAFYRHLFDTMRRTPILDAGNHATGQTAFDRLVPTADLGLALGDGRAPSPALLQTRRLRSVEELRRLLELFLTRLGVTPRDIARFQIRLVKFLTSSPERRRREFERQSWWTFLGGDDERGYSPPMRHYLMETSQALVAMNAEETDARSQGNIVSQLNLHYLENGTDFTLNGPTSDVWLRPWKKYLKRQGVRFFVGELGKLEWRDTPLGPELTPVTTHRSAWLMSSATPIPSKRPGSGITGPPFARRESRIVLIDVLDSSDGDYTVLVSDVVHSYRARNAKKPETAETIAQHLAQSLNDNSAVTAYASGSRIVVHEKGPMHLGEYGKGSSFDDSPLPGQWAKERKVEDAAWVTRDVPEDERKSLYAKIQNAGTSEIELTNKEWVYAGRLRVDDKAFADLLEKYEEARPSELVPCIHVDASHALDLRPPPWVKTLLDNRNEAAASLGGGEVLPDKKPKCPYYFRTKVNGQIQQPILIQIQESADNIGIVEEPVAEDPNTEYRSFAERSPAYQPDFHVLALPFEAASALVWRAEMARPGLLHGCLSELLEFDRRSSRRSVTGREIPLVRDAHGRPPAQYPLRDFAGVQYYFENQVRVGKGHIYFPHAEWGLSSISQLAYWRERMSPAGPFMGQLSVDIGNFYKPARARFGRRLGLTAWNSTQDEIAREVWFQVRQGLERERAGILLDPASYHIDDGLSFGDPTGAAFRGEVVIRLESRQGPYAVWIHGEPFDHDGSEPTEVVAVGLAKAICDAPFGSVAAQAEPASGGAPSLLRVTSAVPSGAALVIVRAGTVGRCEIPVDGRTRRAREVAGRKVQVGRYEIAVDGRTYWHAADGLGDAREVRDSLLAQLLLDSDCPVMAEPSGTTGIRLLPQAGASPQIAVKSDNHGLHVVFGPVIDVRLDQCNGGLSFPDAASATIGRNRTQFLVNIPGQWHYRPGVFEASELTFEETILRPAQDERIRYRISNRRWVAAGTYMATTTQLTTMEAANESARHAVNAILRCLVARPRTEYEYNAQGQVFGDLAEIWDPEKHELEDLEPLKRLDRKLVAEGLPHVLDILKIIDSVDAMPMHGSPSQDPVANVMHLLQHLADDSDAGWSFLKQAVGDLAGQGIERFGDMLDPLGVLRHGSTAAAEQIRQALQSFLERSVRAARGGSGPPP